MGVQTMFSPKLPQASGEEPAEGSEKGLKYRKFLLVSLIQVEERGNMCVLENITTRPPCAVQFNLNADAIKGAFI